MRRLHLVDSAVEDLAVLLTVSEGAAVLRISGSLAYDLACRDLDTGGVQGVPVITLDARPAGARVRRGRAG